MVCKTPDSSMFWGEVVNITLEEADFSKAMETAKKVAESKKENEAIMISWFDGLSKTYSPRVECCSEEMPGWLVYAKSRGANLIVNINKEMFVFAFYLS